MIFPTLWQLMDQCNTDTAVWLILLIPLQMFGNYLCNTCYLDLLFNATVPWALGTVSLRCGGGTVLRLSHVTVVADVISGLVQRRRHGRGAPGGGMLRWCVIGHHPHAGELLLWQPDKQYTWMTFISTKASYHAKFQSTHTAIFRKQ